MEDVFGNMINVKSVPVDCKMNANGEYTVMNSLCDRVDCPSYGKWWCPFTGW